MCVCVCMCGYTVKNNGTLLSFKMWNTLKNVKYH